MVAFEKDFGVYFYASFLVPYGSPIKIFILIILHLR